ncbi:MAG: transketolase [Pseudomonadota bacterium]|nr:transketolase [Pseudomonadota bacterium]MEE2820980.1 transketolase [Pseudomonadota bacterium]
MTDRRTLANAIRFLSIDAVQAANSGHPGAPMGMADIAEVLWRGVLRHNPNNPQWANRDRFVLSNGHGSMLIYSLLHLTGYDVTIDDLKSFRQLHSRTPGHPEYGYTAGIETTTGPLGQGLANAIGMALAERTLAAQFNREQFPIVDHYTYCFAGDGCLMEGVSHEACSLAGTLGLGKLIVFYDDNGISIDGDVRGWFSDDTPARFESYGWQVIRGVDGHDATEVETALKTAREETSRPTLICCRTVIGFGSPNLAGSEKTHGAPLGDTEIQVTRHSMGWSYSPFEIPEDIQSAWDAKEQGAKAQAEWDQLFAIYEKEYSDLATEFERRIQGNLPEGALAALDDAITETQSQSPKLATRKASQNAIEVVAKLLPETFGGSADLGHSNLTVWPDCLANSQDNPGGNYVHYGVREFGMCALMNGVALHSGFLPFGGTFLIFMEYARNAVRMAALMKQRVIYVFTHDSIGLGEDGPTHQPIEQLATLRSTPGLETWRPCDTTETFVAWKEAISYRGPTALVLSRQGLENQPRDSQQIADIARGGYVLKQETSALEMILIATGSEVELAVAAADALGRGVRVVSMPSTTRFDQQDATFRESVLPASCTKRLAIEAGHPDGWYKYVGLDGSVIGMQTFGESGPGGEVMKHFGFTVKNVVTQARVL